MDFSKDHEFLSEALTAVSGDLVLETKGPGPNTKIPNRYRFDYLWNQSPDKIFGLKSFSESIRTWYCPKPLEPKFAIRK